MKNNFNLLIITPTYLPAYHIGGPIFQINKLSNFLQKKKFNHKILSTKKSFNNGGKKNNQTIYLNSYFGKLYFSLDLVFFLVKEIKNFDKVYIVSCFNFFTLFSAIICILFKKHYFLSPRGSLMEKSINFKNKFIKKLWIFLFEKKIIHKAKKIIFSSKFEEIETKKIMTINNSKIIKNFLTIKPSKVERKKLNYLLFLGRITEKKNIDKLIYAYKKDFNFKIKIFGSGDKKYLEFLKKIIKHKDLKNRIYLLPPTYKEETKIKLYKEARFSILLSKTENFGNTILESLLCKTPVIISKNTGLSDLIKRKEVGIICDDKISSLNNTYKNINDGLNIKINEKKYQQIIKIFNDEKTIKEYLKLFN